MKAKEQLLNFINLTLGILLVAFVIYFFIIPGNFERFQVLMTAFAPLLLFLAIFVLRLKRTSHDLKEQGDFIDDGNIYKLTLWDKLRLESVMSLLPILMISWFLAFNLQNAHNIGWAIIIYLVNSYILKSVFNKNKI